MSKNKNRAITARVIGDRNATAAEIGLVLPWPGGHALKVTAVGTAKRETGDRHEPEVGTALAMARALRNAADLLEQHATARVRQVEREKYDENCRREFKRMLVIPRQGLKASEIREKYGENAAQLHRHRKAMRKVAAMVEAHNANA